MPETDEEGEKLRPGIIKAFKPMAVQNMEKVLSEGCLDGPPSAIENMRIEIGNGGSENKGVPSLLPLPLGSTMERMG